MEATPNFIKNRSFAGTGVFIQVENVQCVVFEFVVDYCMTFRSHSCDAVCFKCKKDFGIII